MEDESGLGRRWFLKVVGFCTFLFAIPASIRAFFVDEFYVRTVERDSFHFDPRTGMVRWTGKKDEPYTLSIEGLVEQTVKFSYADLLALPGSQQISDFHCVEGWSVADNRWGGFRFQEIVEKVHPKTGADYVVFYSLGETKDKPGGQSRYVESHPLKYLLDPKKECLMTLLIGNAPLSYDHGAPLRLIAPYSLGYKNIKYISRIEFARQPHPGWWTLANPIYPMQAPVPAKRLRNKISGKKQ
jgi:DMSO/TMAO reductase YedYZ molybdopterin-dependent catalytic subunit